MAKSSSSKESVTRVKATDSKKTKKTSSTDKSTKAVEATVSKNDTVKKSKTSSGRNPLTALLGYFKGAWYELRQVRWPNRRATWSLTGAVLAFSAFFVVFILLLDSLFKYIFELILQ